MGGHCDGGVLYEIPKSIIKSLCLKKKMCMSVCVCRTYCDSIYN